jgi:hypothetical protein
MSASRHWNLLWRHDLRVRDMEAARRLRRRGSQAGDTQVEQASDRALRERASTDPGQLEPPLSALVAV